MGTFYEKIILSNVKDDVRVACGLLDKERAITIDAMPDTGAWTLVINEDVRQQLGLEVINETKTSMADGSVSLRDMTEPVGIRWKDREICLQAIVVPTAKDILLGALALEGMDLCVDPVNHRLVGVHGDNRLHVLY